MDLEQLKENSPLPSACTFDQNESGLWRAQIATRSCTAEIYLQGAHLTRWQPKDHEAVLFVSERSSYTEGKAIRGGVPIIFPWFGPRRPNALDQRSDGPSHGFARTSLWQIESCTQVGDDFELTFSLGPNQNSIALGYDNFLVTYKIKLGSELTMQLTVQNLADGPMFFEEALHTYLRVADASQIGIDGLAHCPYLDKTDNMSGKIQSESTLKLTAETDRPYLNTAAAVELNDPLLKRQIKVSKSNSLTTVIWNPWKELTAKLADMNGDDWQHMTCIETANALDDAITLGPGESHTMLATISVKNQENTHA